MVTLPAKLNSKTVPLFELFPPDRRAIQVSIRSLHERSLDLAAIGTVGLGAKVVERSNDSCWSHLENRALARA